MKKIYVLFVAIFTMAFMNNVCAVGTPYLPPLQSFGGASADLMTFLPTTGDYTLEVQGTVGVEISVAGGVYVYTPTSNGTVRFSQKNGKVYVYEGNEFKTTLTPVANTTYPTIADATADTDPNNLLVNASFEVAGAALSGYTDRFKFGSPWTTNVIEAGTGIRVMSPTTGNVNGINECVWRGSGNTNYFAQQLAATIKPNTAYKVIVNQIAGGNAYASFNVGLGSTDNGLEYGYKPIVLGNTKNGTWSVDFRTPSSITAPVYFTFKNTATNTASSGSDPVVQMDYLALVEGIDIAGITGVSAAAFLDGTAYAPENVAIDYTAGDYFDMSTMVINPTIEGASNGVVPTGWTVDKGTGNTFTATGQHYSGVTTNRYLDSWNATAGSMLYTAQQTLTGIPNGVYKLSAAARTSGAGSYIVAKTSGNTYMTEIINNANAGGTLGNGFNTIVVYATVLDNTLTIAASTSAAFTGGTTWGGTWFSVDDFVLSYYGEQIMDVTVNDPENARLLFSTVGETIVVPIVAYGYTNGFTVAADQPALFEVTNGSLSQSGGSVSVRFIGNTVGVYNGLLNITMDAPAAAPGMSKIISIGNSIQIPMVASITTAVNNLSSDHVKTFIADNDIVAQFNLSKTSEVALSVYNVNGMLISKDVRTISAGKNQFTLNANLSSGVYFVKTSIDGKITTAKLVK